MSLHTPFPQGGDLCGDPAYGFDGCTCGCHRMQGVFHCVPCCGPSSRATAVAEPAAAQRCDWDAWKPAREVA